MKVWLNNLKNGDIFYHIILHKVCKCIHLGEILNNAHKPSYRIPTIKFKFFKGQSKEDSGELETYVNQYVYDNEQEAQEALKYELRKELLDVQMDINQTKTKLKELENQELELKKLLKDDKYNT